MEFQPQLLWLPFLVLLAFWRLFFFPLRHQPGILNHALHLHATSWTRLAKFSAKMTRFEIRFSPGKPIGFHVWNIYSPTFCLNLMVNVGKYSIPWILWERNLLITLQILCEACRRKLQKLMLARNFSPPEAILQLLARWIALKKIVSRNKWCLGEKPSESERNKSCLKSAQLTTKHQTNTMFHHVFHTCHY